MESVRTVTFVLFDNPYNGDRVQTVIAGDDGQGDALVAAAESQGTVVEISVCDVADISPRSALWETGALGPRPETVRALGSVAGGPNLA